MFRNQRLLIVCLVAFCHLAVFGQPVILVQPVGATNAAVGSDITLSVVANSDTPQLNYQWQRNGVNIAGATDSSFELPNVTASSGGLFDVVVDDGLYAASSDSVTVTINLGAVITNNDNFSNRFVIPSNVIIGSLRCVNTNSTKESHEVNLVKGDPGGKSVWFQWTATNSGNVTFSTQGSDFDTIIGEYPEFQIRPRGQPPRVYGNDDGGDYFTSLITFAAASNATYYIGVDGHFGASGDIVLNWFFDPLAPPVPTITASPPPFVAGEFKEVITLAVTNDIGTWLWLSNGLPTVDTKPTYTIPPLTKNFLAVYQVQISSQGGTVKAPPTRIEVSELEDGNISFQSTAYSKFADAVFNAYVQPPPVGQHVKTGGGDTRGYTLAQTFSTVGAVTEPGEPLVCQQKGGAPMWYAYVAQTNGDMEVDTIGSGFNTILGVFTGAGNSFAALTNIGCGYTTNRNDNGQPQVYIPGIPKGQTNYIVVDGEHGATGVVELHIALGAPVNIVAGPTNVVAAPGSSAAFIVTATGSTPMNYYWQNQNGPLEGDAVLTLTNLGAADSGTYTVTIQNDVSQASASAVLTVLTPPVITNQPGDLTVNTGSTATFDCGVSGAPPFGFKWLFQNSVVVGFDPTLVLTNIKRSQAGGYSCVVTNPGGQISSRVAQLTVYQPPQITLPPVSRTVPSNGAATLNVTASAFPAPAYQWWFQNQPLGGDAPSLGVSNFSAANEGPYVVVITNLAGVATSPPAYLLLDSPLRFRSFSIQSNLFHAELIGAVNSNYLIQTATDLIHWSPFLTNSSPRGLLDFAATNPPSAPPQFFRATER